jgi:hypothetical protein
LRLGGGGVVVQLVELPVAENIRHPVLGAMDIRSGGMLWLATPSFKFQLVLGRLAGCRLSK